MGELLDGKEVDVKFDGGNGSVVLDVDVKGSVKFDFSYKRDVLGYAKVGSSASVEANILDIAAKIAAKTSTTWDDAAVSMLKKLLGIGEEVIAAAEVVADKETPSA